jgi:hypothetical protein
MDPNFAAAWEQLKLQFQSNKTGFVVIVLGFLLIGSLGWAFVNALIGADPQTRAAIIAAFTAALVAILSNFKQKQKDLELKMREQKIPAYEKILTMMRSTLLSFKEGNDINVIEMVKQYYDINYALIIAGSEDVLKEWILFYSHVSTPFEANNKAASALHILHMRMQYGRVLRSIRNDLGHRTALLSDENLADLAFPLDPSAREELLGNLSGLGVPADSE